MTHRGRFGLKNPFCEQIQARRVEAKAAHAAACAAGKRQRQSDVPLLRGFESAVLYLEEALAAIVPA